MKVLFVNLVYGTGSTGKIIADIMNLLKKYGNDVKALYGTGALLICIPEPVVDANPYFFFAILMLLGGIKGLECSFCKKDTAESERRF